MTLRINRDTTLCISLSARPSNIGTRFHNYLYEALGLDFVYKAFATADIAGAVRAIRALGIRGAAVSMPFKSAVIPLIDELDHTAEVIGAVNTIVNTDGVLRGHNTDFAAVRALLAAANLPPATSIAVLGAGGMAKAVVAAIRDLGFEHCTVSSRNPAAGQALAAQYGYRWSEECPGVEVLINATPVGMAGGPEADELPVPAETVAVARLVFDVVAMPAETPLIRLARKLGKAVILGTEVMTLQAVEQFVLYTGVRPSAEQVAAAGEFARG